MFPKYFEVLLQNENQQTKEDKCIQLSIIEFMINLKHDLIQDNRAIFDESQILFCLPAEWTDTKYENNLRSLFLEAGWVTTVEHSNCLIFSNFIDRLVNYLQNPNYANKKFERERKYLFCHINESFLKLTCFQMQSAKELIAISKQIAASNFLLSPTILDDESVCVSSFDTMIYIKVKNMITSRITSNGPKNTIHNKPGVHTLIGKIVKNIAYIYIAVS